MRPVDVEEAGVAGRCPAPGIGVSFICSSCSCRMPIPFGVTHMNPSARTRFKLLRTGALGLFAAMLCTLVGPVPRPTAAQEKPRFDGIPALPRELDLIPRDAAAFVT